jgi:mono/diheme cytochrome c family protein
MSFKLAVVACGALVALIACQQGEPPAAPAAPRPATAPAAAPPAAPAPSGAPAAPAVDGRVAFMQACATCHGVDGTGAMMRGMMPNIGDLTSAELHARMSDEQLAAQIRDGKDKMPPFKSVLSPEQISAIVKYVRTLKK